MVMFYSIQGTMKSAPFKLKLPFLMSLMIFQTALFLSESFLILKCTRNLSEKASVCAFSLGKLTIFCLFQRLAIV